MRLSRMTLWILPVAVPLTAGCANDLAERSALLTKENEELRSQLVDRNTAMAGLEQDMTDRDVQLAEMRRNAAYEQAPLAQVTGFEQIPNVSAEFGAGEVTVAVESDVLFASGKATLKAAAKQSLGAIVSVLNHSYGDRTIRVVGHTDSDPIRKSGHKTNYHLGFERAFAVREYLIDRGVAAQRVSLASYGPDRPRGTKANSRRVEIVVVME
ncbi:MAG: OmpA family protein [Longimicrobiales bacterium]